MMMCVRWRFNAQPKGQDSNRNSQAKGMHVGPDSENSVDREAGGLSISLQLLWFFIFILNVLRRGAEGRPLNEVFPADK